MTQSLDIGAIVLPAKKGTLDSLGFDVEELSTLAVGVVIQAKKNQSLVRFPKIPLSTWLPNDELLNASDLEGHSKMRAPELSSTWLIHKLVTHFSPQEIISLDLTSQNTISLILCVDHIEESSFSQLNEILGSHLIKSFVNPLGMHRMEWHIELKESLL